MYFDGWTYDCFDNGGNQNANAAYFIDGQADGAYANNPLSPHARLPFWGEPGGGADKSFFFDSGGKPQVADFLIFDGAWAPFNSLGWYDPTVPFNCHMILAANGSQPNPGKVEFSTTRDFGLCFVPDSLTFDPTKSYYTQAAHNGVADADVLIGANPALESNYQHFAVFDDGQGGFYIGVKDRSLQVGDHDYNDLILKIDPVPEPGLLAPVAGMLALLILLLAIQQRRQIH